MVDINRPPQTENLKRSMAHAGQIEPAIITCDGFLINGNRRKMVLEKLGHDHQGEDKYDYMKVVILPGSHDPGGPPTLVEIEKLENRYQLQNEGKSEYYGFDRALSIKRKIDMGFSLEEQLKDDPRFAEADKKELSKAVEDYKERYLQPLECVERYLRYIGRKGMYGCISEGQTDKEGRWYAFFDYSKAWHTKLTDREWQMQNGLDEDDIGTVEEAAFKIIRLRYLKGLPKLHVIMRELPKMCAKKESKKDVLKIANVVEDSIPKEELHDADGKALTWDELDNKWAERNKQTLIQLTKRALDYVAASDERETPLTRLEAALKKLNHESFSTDNISLPDYPKAHQLAVDIKNRAHDIERDLYANKKKIKELAWNK
jgi:hypothetical protein